jgi:hypothetical protein
VFAFVFWITGWIWAGILVARYKHEMTKSQRKDYRWWEQLKDVMSGWIFVHQYRNEMRMLQI